jgi:hypothetical protein
MAQDLRNLFEENKKTVKNVNLSKGHEQRFYDRLEREFPNQTKTKRFSFLYLAASVVALLGLAYSAFVLLPKTGDLNKEPAKMVNNSIKSLGEMSPDLKKVEDYYLASINLELSKLELTPQNKEFIDGYMERLKELNDEYGRLTLELNQMGLNEATLDALINNLKFRLNLVMRLKEKLKEFNEDPMIQESI